MHQSYLAALFLADPLFRGVMCALCALCMLCCAWLLSILFSLSPGRAQGLLNLFQ